MATILFDFLPLSSRIIGFDVKLQPLSSIIVGNVYEFQAGSICPRMAKGSSEGGKREAKGAPKGTKGAQRTPKGAQRTPKGSPRVPKGVKRASKSAQGRPKVLQTSRREKIYTKKLPINRPSGRYVIKNRGFPRFGGSGFCRI